MIRASARPGPFSYEWRVLPRVAQTVAPCLNVRTGGSNETTISDYCHRSSREHRGKCFGARRLQYQRQRQHPGRAHLSRSGPEILRRNSHQSISRRALVLFRRRSASGWLAKIKSLAMAARTQRTTLIPASTDRLDLSERVLFGWEEMAKIGATPPENLRLVVNEMEELRRRREEDPDRVDGLIDRYDALRQKLAQSIV